MLIEKRNALPRAVARTTGRNAGKTIDVPADDVSQRMARQRVAGQQDDVRQQHQRADTYAKVSSHGRVKPKSRNRVVPENHQEDDGNIEKVAMQILQNKGKPCFASVTSARRLADRTGRRIEKKRAIVSFAIVITRRPKAERRPENQDRRRQR